MLHDIKNKAKLTLNKIELAWLGYAIVFLTTTIRPLYAIDNLSAMALKQISAPDGLADIVEMDSATNLPELESHNQVVKLRPAISVESDSIQPEESMHTIDSESVKTIASKSPSQTTDLESSKIDVESSKAAEPETPMQTIDSESAPASAITPASSKAIETTTPTSIQAVEPEIPKTIEPPTSPALQSQSAKTDKPPTPKLEPTKAVELESPMQTIDSESVKAIEPHEPDEPIHLEPALPFVPEMPSEPVNVGPAQSIETETSTPPTEREIPKSIEPEPIIQNTETKPSEVSEPEPNKPVEPEAVDDTGETPPVKKDRGEQAIKVIEHLPQRLALFAAGAMVGAPITVVRRSIRYTASNTKELVGDKTNPVLVVPASALSLPYAVTSGLIEGTVFGISNSWKHSVEGHLSKASLGLEEDKK